jgi:hypothetical protein
MRFLAVRTRAVAPIRVAADCGILDAMPRDVAATVFESRKTQGVSRSAAVMLATQIVVTRDAQGAASIALIR